MKKTNVLVTGGAGFIGSHVVDELIALGYSVVVLDDLSGGFRNNVNPKATFVKGSVTNHKLIDSLFDKHDFTYVYHLAAYAAEGLSHFIRRFNYTNNLLGSINLVNASVRHKVKCFVFTSSIAVYGPAQFPMKEDTAPIPEDPYGIAKYAVELDLQAAHEMFGLDYVIFRPHNVYGERQNIGDKYRNVLGIFMNNVLKGIDMPIFGDGKQKRAFTYIADVAPIIARAPLVKKAYNRVFNIGADIPYTVKELALVVGKAMGQVKPKIKYLPARKEVKVAYADHSLTRKVFGIKKTPVTLEEGVSRMVEWVKKEGAKKSADFKGIEITENLPSSWR